MKRRMRRVLKTPSVDFLNLSFSRWILAGSLRLRVLGFVSRRIVLGFAAAFLYRVDLVHGHVLEPLGQPAGPANVYPINFRRRPQTKMHSHIIVRSVASPATHLV